MLLDALLTRLAIPLGARELNPLQVFAGTNFGLIIHLCLAGIIVVVIHHNRYKIEQTKKVRVIMSTLLFIMALVVMNNSYWMYNTI